MGEEKTEKTMIEVAKSTALRLKRIEDYGETYDDVLVRLLDAGELTLASINAMKRLTALSMTGETFDALVNRLLGEHDKAKKS